MPKSENGICVVIAAYNAAATIGRAVKSALAQADVVEVLVVDDASSDDTGFAARAADDGTGRLAVHSLASNGGPSHARNLAIARSHAPLIAILDADDFFLPGRFSALLQTSDWDFVADNIAFVDEHRLNELDEDAIIAHRTAPRLIDTVAFVAGSITRRGRYKSELAFLKPLFRRHFIDAHGLLYDETMRLAEDYDLYVRAMMAGALFRVIGTCGYVSVDRFGSLSHLHSVADLRRFEDAIARLHSRSREDAPLRAQLGRHLRQTRRKRRHREFLSRKREVGLIRAIVEQTRAPFGLPAIAYDIARDKLGDRRPPPDEPDRAWAPRFLF